MVKTFVAPMHLGIDEDGCIYVRYEDIDGSTNTHVLLQKQSEKFALNVLARIKT